MIQWLKTLFSSFTATKQIPAHYRNLDRDQLIQKIQTLENQLRKTSHLKQFKDHAARPFDMSQYGQRRIALKIAYLGWHYSGFATQNDELSIPTIEGQLFKALTACKLITHPGDCDFSRCGRTDRGVSGLGQVVALNVRSTHQKKNSGLTEEPLRYIEIINRLLPEHIRVLAWAPVHPTFNARFDCKSRTYKYFFQKGQLDLDLMRQTAKYMTGSHDFRNFCRLDPSKNITNYVRHIVYMDINHVSGDFYQVELKGTAFLWHQVRCMMAVLFLVGQKLEKPEVVKAMLDISQVPSRPEYSMASDLPLMLYDCEFDGIDWIYANEGRNIKIPTPARTYRHFHELWNRHVIKGHLYNTVLKQIEQDVNINGKSVIDAMKESDQNQAVAIMGAGRELRANQHKPLLSRPRADTDDIKKEKYAQRQLRKLSKLGQ